MINKDKTTFTEYVNSFSNIDKNKIWSKAMDMSRNTNMDTVDIWLELLVDIHSDYLTKVKGLLDE